MIRPICSHSNVLLINSTELKTVNYSCSRIGRPYGCIEHCIDNSTCYFKGQNKTMQYIAFTDVLTGLIKMPRFFVIFLFIAEGKSPCFLIKILPLCFLCVRFESFLIVTGIAFESYINIFHPYFYASKVTLRTIGACIEISWAVSLLAAIYIVVKLDAITFNSFIGIVIVAGMALNFCCYMRILLRARRVRLRFKMKLQDLATEPLPQRISVALCWVY